MLIEEGTPSRELACDLEGEVEAQRVVHIEHEWRGNQSDSVADPFDGYCPNLLCLSLRVDIESGFGRREEHLERVYLVEACGDGNNRHHSAPEARRGCVRPIVGDDHRWTHFVSFASESRVEVHPANLVSSHLPTTVATVAGMEIPGST